MIIQTKALKLVKIYLSIFERFEKDLQYTCMRFSNNNKQDLTNQEIMTIYLFAIEDIMYETYVKLNSIVSALMHLPCYTNS